MSQKIESPEPQHSPGRIFYGWYIVAAGTISSFVNMAVFMVGLSIFIKDLRDEMGWTLTAISIGFSLKTLETGILAPLSGYLIDRLGPRIMAIFGNVVMTIGLLMFANMHTMWEFYLSSFTIALGQGMGAHMAYITPVMHWFHNKRGMASSFLAMGRGWGYIGSLPITILLVAFGWRDAAAIAALVFLAINFPMALLLRASPEPYGWLPDGAVVPDQGSSKSDSKGIGKDDGSYTVKDAMKTRAFWFVLLANSIYSFGTSTNHTHFITHLRFTGFTAPSAAVVVSIYGVVQVLGRLSSGWIGDKMGRHRLLMWSFVLMGLGWVAIAFITPDRLWWVGLYYLTYGLGQAAHTVTQQTIVADFFGPKRYATLRGIMNPIGVMGGVLGPLFAGVMFDAQGSYQLAFIIIGPMVALGFPAIRFAGVPQLIADPLSEKNSLK
ncbi:MAG: MFS family permease/MFS family permease [Chloroflexi bacterium]|jgi:MFS family permease|nr:MAG: MFS family permease/MFS family permease [Chloroflexota bacterium]